MKLQLYLHSEFRVNETRTFSVEGAKYVRLRIKKYDLENNYDFLVIKDSQGNQIEKISGSGEDYVSFHVSGDSMDVTFISDSSVNKWGFEIESVDAQF